MALSPSIPPELPSHEILGKPGGFLSSVPSVTPNRDGVTRGAGSPCLGGAATELPGSRKPRHKEECDEHMVPINPGEFFFFFIFSWCGVGFFVLFYFLIIILFFFSPVFRSSAGEEEKRQLWRVRSWVKGEGGKERAKCSEFFFLFNPFLA